MNLTFDLFWLVPLIGAGAFVAALFVGRSFFAARPRNSEDAIFVPSFLQGVTQDRRALPRRKGNAVVVLIDAGQGEPASGQVLDRSQGGLRIQVEIPFAEGAVVKVRPTDAPVTTPWTEATIRACKRNGTHYELSCQFDRTPNWCQLLQFG